MSTFGRPPRKALRSSALKRSGPIKPKKRKPSEYARIYGSKARVEWVKSLPCAGCGISGYSENAHVVRGDGGTGRKASARFIAPLCGPRPSHVYLGGQYRGCHRTLHALGAQRFERVQAIDLAACAAETAAAWEGRTA